MTKKKKITEFVEGKEYSYNNIEKYAIENERTIEEFGEELIGEHFIVLKTPEYDLITSFMLSGSSVHGYQYKCIYTDYVF